MPFFVLGLCLQPKHFAMVRSWNVRLLAVPFFAVVTAFAYWAAPRMAMDWFYHRESAEELGVSTPVPLVMTLAMFACSLVLVAGFFSWVPGRRLWVTGMGATTLYVYLLHGFLVKGAEYGHWYDNSFVHTPKGEFVVTLVAAAVAVVLGTAPFRVLFRPVVEPGMDWAFRVRKRQKR
jgi:fucose 4-O-acetylase-like acetyltransferase